MPAVLVRHDEILRAAIEGHDGVVLSEMGDGVAGPVRVAVGCGGCRGGSPTRVGRRLVGRGVRCALAWVCTRGRARCARMLCELAVADDEETMGQVVAAELGVSQR